MRAALLVLIAPLLALAAPHTPREGICVTGSAQCCIHLVDPLHKTADYYLNFIGLAAPAKRATLERTFGVGCIDVGEGECKGERLCCDDPVSYCAHIFFASVNLGQELTL